MNQDVQSTETGSGSTAHLFAVKLLEKLVDLFKGLLTGNFLKFCIKWLSHIGHWGIVAAAGLGFLFSLIFAIRANDFNTFFFGIVWVLLIFVAQYTAHKFLSAGDKLIGDNPSYMTSKTFLNCFGFLAAIGGVVIFILSIINLIKGRGFDPFMDFLYGLAYFIILEFIALVAFNPHEATVEIEEHNSAGQEAIGIVTFFIKTVMRLIPIFFGALIAVGVVIMVIKGIGLFGNNMGGSMRDMVQKAVPLVLYGALLPFLSYLFFVLAYLVIDIIRAILSIPDKK
ncbi:MAG: hypothetical protein GY940_43825 [bacterium]|nr:hypothetical protein [bacterium]